MTLEIPKSFMFIGDLLNLQIDEPIEIFPDCVLKKADDSQIELINQQLNKYQFLTIPPIARYTYESRMDEESGHSWKQLSKTNWKYYIIEYDIKVPHPKGPINGFEINLNKALILSSLNLNIIYDVSYVIRRFFEIDGSSSSINHFRIINFFNELDLISPVTKIVVNEHIEEIRNVYKLIDDFDTDSFKDINKAVEDFQSLSMFPRYGTATPFKVVAMFSILEFLLVNPKNNLDSITHQLKKKIPLLNNRFNKRLDFSVYFQGPDTLTEEKIIEKLYKYRSSIAHGSLVDFQNELQILENHDKTYEFLYTLLRLLIIQALKEPRLFTDLKNI